MENDEVQVPEEIQETVNEESRELSGDDLQELAGGCSYPPHFPKEGPDGI